MENLKKLPVAVLGAMADALESGKMPWPASSFSLQRYIERGSVDSVEPDLAKLAERGFNAPQAAFLIRTLFAGGAEAQTATHDLVLTGPEAAGINTRDTGVVVRELFASAQQEVLVVGYAVYQGKRVFAALAENMDRNPNLKVTFCLDVRRAAGDTSIERMVVSRWAEKFKARDWPGKRLPEVYYDPRSLENEGKTRAALHAKCVVVDRKVAFVSSANFTEAAQERNIEVGVLVQDADQAGTLVDYFGTLVKQRVLRHVPIEN